VIYSGKKGEVGKRGSDWVIEREGNILEKIKKQEVSGCKLLGSQHNKFEDGGGVRERYGRREFCLENMSVARF